MCEAKKSSRSKRLKRECKSMGEKIPEKYGLKGSPLVWVLALNYFASLDVVSCPAFGNPIKKINYHFNVVILPVLQLKQRFLSKHLMYFLSITSQKYCGFPKVAWEISRFQVFSVGKVTRY